MRNLLFKNAKVYYEDQFQNADVLIRDGIVVGVGREAEAPSDTLLVDSQKFHILPGLADIHVHLREPGFSYKETIATGTRAAAKGGFTLICAMPNVDPVPDCPENLKLQREMINRTALIKVIPYAAITMGQEGRDIVDMEALAGDSFAYSDDGNGVWDAALMENAMIRAERLGKTIAAHCEDKSLIPRGACVHDGWYATRHGLPGIPSSSEYSQVRRDIALAEKTGCSYHVCHVSCKESVDAIREARSKGLAVSGETAPHYLVFCDEDLRDDGRYKMNPPIRSRQDRQALIEGIKDKTLQIIATDHAPHTTEEKSKGLQNSNFGIVGLETSFAAMHTYLCKAGHITLEQLAQNMSINPRKLFGLPYGIRVGQRADLIVADLQKEIIVDPEGFESLGRSTPFEGMSLYGEILLTIFDGNIVYNNIAF
jgi:dihydroorotase